MGITSILVGSVYFSFSNVMNGRERIKSRTERIRKLYFALDIMKRDIENAYLTTHKGTPEETHVTLFKGEEDHPVSHVTFATVNHSRMRSDVKECDQGEVEYYGERGEEGYILYRRESFWVDQFPEKGGNVYPLLDDFVMVKFEYWDDDDREWISNWDTDSVDTPDILPAKVKITIVLEDKRMTKGENKIETIVNIRYRRPYSF